MSFIIKETGPTLLGRTGFRYNLRSVFQVAGNALPAKE